MLDNTKENVIRIGSEDPFLSVLIPTVESRKESLNRLVLELNRICLERSYSIEIITLLDNFENTVGVKRTRLRELSTAPYSCFIDDDDMVSEQFMENAFQCYKLDLDCCKVIGLRTNDGKEDSTFELSIRNLKLIKLRNKYLNYVSHLNPIKNELCRDIPFPDMTTGEDTLWSERLMKMKVIKNEYNKGHKPTYFYNFSSRETLTQKKHQLENFRNEMHKYRK